MIITTLPILIQQSLEFYTQLPASSFQIRSQTNAISVPLVLLHNHLPVPKKRLHGIILRHIPIDILLGGSKGSDRSFRIVWWIKAQPDGLYFFDIPIIRWSEFSSHLARYHSRTIEKSTGYKRQQKGKQI